MVNYIQVLILALIQGACELLPVSSSAHVIAAEKLMGLDPSSPEMTMLLVMLHTGTMFAVIVYFWRRWQCDYFSAPAKTERFCRSNHHRDGLHGSCRFWIEIRHRTNLHARRRARGD